MIIWKLISFLVIGLVAGWIAGKIMKGKGFGFWGNLVVGIAGAFIGGFLYGIIEKIMQGFIGSLIVATAGAIILIFIVGLIKKM